jgi:sec-independent protein translocase protein TatA
MNVGPFEIAIIVLLILVLFGYKKLPAASRSLGQSLRIFKGEMKGMKNDDVAGKDEARATPVRGELTARPATSGDLTAQLHDEARAADVRAPEFRADQSGSVDGPR